MVGVSESSGWPYHGFLFDGTNWTTLDAPNGYDTFPEGVYENNIVGFYLDNSSNEARSFLYNDVTKAWTAFDAPGSMQTEASDIDGDNIVGWYKDITQGDLHGFVYDYKTGAWTTLDYPGAWTTVISGISGNTFVGYYSYPANPYSANPYPSYQGFIYTTPEPSTIVLLLIAGLASLPIFLRKLKGR